MNQIVPHPLWVGHADDGRDVKALFEADLRAVVQLAVEEPPLLLPREFILCRFPLVDGTGNRPELLRLAASTLAQLLAAGVNTLVCCGSGLSRAPVIAAAGLSLNTTRPIEECLKQVTEHRHCDVHPGLYQEIIAALAGAVP